jgi:polar amino acid transport system permease protein
MSSLATTLFPSCHQPLSPNFDGCYFAQLLFGTSFLVPAALVLAITLGAQTVGVILGFPLALGRMSRNRLLKALADLYVYFWRGTPLLLQVFLIYDGLAQVGGTAVQFITFNPIAAGALALTLNEGAYMAEIIRSGLQAIDPGQTDAAKALGMTRLQTLRRLVVPQALRIIVPPTFNEYINMSKNTALLAVISVNELLDEAQRYVSLNFRPFEAILVAGIWYLAITTVLTAIQSRIEAGFGERRDQAVAPRATGAFRRFFMGGVSEHR